MCEHMYDSIGLTMQLQMQWSVKTISSPAWTVCASLPHKCAIDSGTVATVLMRLARSVISTLVSQYLIAILINRFKIQLPASPLSATYYIM